MAQDATTRGQKHVFRLWGVILLAVLFSCALAGCFKQPAQGVGGSGSNEARNKGHVPPSNTRPPSTGETQQPLASAEHGKTIVLALPLSGQYSSMGLKIVAGAQAAQGEMQRSGVAHTLLVIDTNMEAWADKIAALPAEATVVGGPLLVKDYATAKGRGLTSRRAFFTFLPRLDAGDEGNQAWRMFPSPQDQVSALTAFTKILGITRYGALYPDDAASKRIVDLFELQARAVGGQLTQRSTYSYNRPAEWSSVTASYLSARKGGAASAAFEATFLPDIWKNAEALVPNFFYYGATQQILLGTALWEQGLAGAREVPVRYFERAIFPGAWQPNRPSQAVESLQVTMSSSGKTADFWVALGYDFMRLSTALFVPESWSQQQLNGQLASLREFPFSLAQFYWNTIGIGGQELFLFTPTGTGFIPVTIENFQR